MGFLERSRSLRRKDSALPLRVTTEQTSASRWGGKDAKTTPITPRDVSGRPSTTGKSTASGAQKAQNETGRPRTAGRATDREQNEQPPMPGLLPDHHSFKFPTPQDSPRASASHSRNFTLQGNGSMQAVNSPRQAPEYKRSFTSPMHVPQASIHNGAVKLDTKNLPDLDSLAASKPVPKKPTLHKSKSSTWRSFFSRKQSKPPIPDFDPSEFAPPLPSKKVSSVLPVIPTPRALPAPLPKREPTKEEASPIPPPKINGHARSESRGMARQTLRAELDKNVFVKHTTSPQQKTPAGSRRGSFERTRPAISRSVTEGSLSVSEQFYDAVSQNGSVTSGSPRSGPMERGPRLEISIPAVELDRYSVMFEKLLKPKQSLLERRKTTIQGLSLPNGMVPDNGRLTPSLDTPGRPQRRATSPNIICPTPLTAELMESSSQMATPVAMHRVSAQPPRILLKRSHTAPPGALTPSRVEDGNKERVPQQVQQEAGDNTVSACSTRHSHIWSEASLPATPATTSSDTGTFMSFNDSDSDNEEDEEEEAEIMTYDSRALKRSLKEPAWEMITQSPISMSPAITLPPPIPPRAPGRATSRERQDNHPPRTSSLDSANSGSGKQTPHIVTQAVSHPSPLQSHQVRRPVQISIARQISVRKPSATRSVSNPTQPTMSVQPVYSKQPLRPKVVEVRNRKSTMIVFDSASSSASESRESLSLFPSLAR